MVTGIVVGVSGFEPEASWTRTKRDTKLRHTPIDQIIIMKNNYFVKGQVCTIAANAFHLDNIGYIGVILWVIGLTIARVRQISEEKIGI